jgi:hypothetical protein
MNRRVFFQKIPSLAAVGAACPSILLLAQNQKSGEPVIKPPPQDRLTAGEAAATQLLLLMDTDKDGMVSKAEFMSFMSAEFDHMDMNHDGKLDVRELARFVQHVNGKSTR